MSIDVNLATSRNSLPKYTYFLVRKNSNKIHSQLPLKEYTMYVFVNPVTSDRGVKILTDSYTEEILPVSNEFFENGGFFHNKYTNQNKEPLKFLYKDIEQIIVPIIASRTENIVIFNAQKS